MKRNLLGLTAVLILATLACGLIVPATFQALTDSAPPTQTPVSGIPVAVNNIAFVIPTGIGSGAQVETVQAVPPSNNMPWWEIAPSYHKYSIQGYPLSNTFHTPTIYVYPVDQYVQMNEDVASVVDKLKTIINSPSQPMPENLPFLPACL
jgi:hypothetical protein